MPRHHPGTLAAQSNTEVGSLPRVLTTHLLLVNHEQLLHVTQHPFLAHAANGTLTKPVIAQWLVNCESYLGDYIDFISNLLEQIKSKLHSVGASEQEPTLEKRIITFLDSALENAKREETFFKEVAEIYNIDTIKTTSQVTSPCEGLDRFQYLFTGISDSTKQQPNSFLPWLEGLVFIWAKEKIYYEAWSWAQRQSTHSEPRVQGDADDGAMRREFIPNWSNRHYMLFVEQLERILNEGVSAAVARSGDKWVDVKRRADVVWRQMLIAEDALWPDVSGVERADRNWVNGNTVVEEKIGNIRRENPLVRV